MNEICELKQILLQNITPGRQQTLVDEYIADLLKSNNWCGAETIISVVQLYNVNVSIHTEDGPPLIFEAPNGGGFNVNLYFSGTPIKNHYDVVIDVQDDGDRNIHVDRSEEVSGMEPEQIPHYEPEEISTPSKRPRSTIINATLSCLLKLDPSGWEFQINSLNLKKATIKELSIGINRYAQEMKMPVNALADLLTYWDETEDLDVKACGAIANVLELDIYMYDSNGTQVFKGRNNLDNRAIAIEHQHNTFVPKIRIWDHGRQENGLSGSEPEQNIPRYILNIISNH